MAELVVPIRDRRQRKRILTLKNFGRFAIAIGVVFAGLTRQSELRHTHSDDFGSLFRKQVGPKDDIAKPKFDVVKEAPVADQTAADPTLIEASRRAQYLTDNTNVVPPAAPPQPAPVTAEVVAPHQPIGSGVAIVGGSDGVTIVRGDGTKRPVLQGGIFKQQ